MPQMYKIYEHSEQCERIIWNVESIASAKNANGYIVQTVTLTPDDIEPLEYLEAWKVQNGITSHGRLGHVLPYDDEFSCKIKGKPAKYITKVYWFANDNPNFQIINSIPYGDVNIHPWGDLQGTCEIEVISSIINGQESLCRREFYIKG